MGIRLKILSWWTPNYIISRQLEVVWEATSDALKSLLKIYSPKTYVTLQTDEKKSTWNIEKRRAVMATQHAAMVDALVEAVGKDKATKLGREALFEVGKKLGQDTRKRLGITNNPEDLIKAAKVLYRVLGIKFNVEWLGKTNATLIVYRCDLAKKYSEMTCLILSATDEGVINGLEPSAKMTFQDKITAGCSKCTAQIRFN